MLFQIQGAWSLWNQGIVGTTWWNGIMTRIAILVASSGMEVVMVTTIDLKQKKNVKKPVLIDEQVSCLLQVLPQ